MSNSNDRIVKPGEKIVERISLAHILVSYNHRDPIPDLRSHFVEEGITKTVPIKGKKGETEVVSLTALEFLHQYAISEDPDKRRKYVQLMEKYESGVDGIVPHAESRRVKELHPINLRRYGVKQADGSYQNRYGIIGGERRTLMAGYLHAKYDDKPTVGALTDSHITVEQAGDLGFDENAKQRKPTDLEYGRRFRALSERVNPATGKNYTLKEVAQKLGYTDEAGYQFVVTREALTYLPSDDQAKLEASLRADQCNGESSVKRVKLTVAVAKGRAIKCGKDCEGDAIQTRKETRRRAMNMAEVQVHFDANRDKSQDYLTALAAVMRLTLAEAVAESEIRFTEASKRDVREATRNDRAASVA